ncbi:porin family protein [Roseateles koreensis]|uniref:Beta-barrel porin 2 n=1 Tax=Roseateles koreensis TaxID=2987526 RepID=A0ABT5KUT0_9BURK|nr:hypothetical protein [Roseateles koreensis]MDC8786674.1 hypothetical protein [Roseateles koreensis]
MLKQKQKISARLTPWLSAACLLSGASAAWAEATPFYYGGSVSLNHVSNLYRVSNNPNSDDVATVSLLGGIDQHLGRQRVFADASLQNSRYRSSSNLNNSGYSLKGGLDWSTIERISGTLSGSSSRSLANYNVGGGIAPVFEKNIETNNQIDSVVRLGLVTKFTLEGDVGFNQRRFTLLQYHGLEFDQLHYSLGLNYQPSSDLRLGVAVRRTSTNYPRSTQTSLTPTFASAKYVRNDIDLTTNWNISGKSAIFARLSSGRQTLAEGGNQNFSGLTGQVSWTWQPTARWNITTSASRDTGLQSSLFQLGAVNTNYDQDSITKALQISATYELTSKIFLTGGASISSVDRKQSLLAIPGLDSSSFDKDKSFNLGVRWAYSRGITLGCQAGQNSRDSSTVYSVYTANNFGCYGQLIVN